MNLSDRAREALEKLGLSDAEIDKLAEQDGETSKSATWPMKAKQHGGQAFLASIDSAVSITLSQGRDILKAADPSARIVRRKNATAKQKIPTGITLYGLRDFLIKIMPYILNGGKPRR